MSTITEVRDGVGAVRPAAGRHPEGQGRVRLLVGHVGRGHAVGRDAALARTRARASAAIEHRRGARRPGRARRADPRGRARAQDATGSSTTTSPCWRSPRSATRASRWRSSPPTTRRPRAARPTGSRSTTRSSSRSPTPSSRSRPIAAAAPRRATCCATCTSRTATGAGRGRRRGHRRVRGRHAGPGVPRAGVRARGPGRGRRRRPVHRDPVAARRPRPGRRLPRPAGREGAVHARRRGRRVRRARGPLDADPRLPARAAHRPAGEDGLRARGVVLRPRPPPSGADALRARRRRATGGSSTSRRRILLDGGAYASSSTAVVLATPRRSRSGPTRCPSARIDAYVVYTDNPPCGAMRGFGAVQTCFAHEAQMDKLAAALEHGPGRAAAAQRDGHGHARCRPARRSTAPRRSRELLRAACATRPLPDGDGGVPGRDRERRPTARASCAASATPSASRTSASPRASTTTRPRACGCRWPEVNL